MKVRTLAPTMDPFYPRGVSRLEYRSDYDGQADWALVLPPRDASSWIIMIHGHGSQGDQLYKREDIRRDWAPAFISHNLGILTPNLRGNAWMSPPAAADLHSLIAMLREEYAAKSVILFSGSMGGTSNLIYAALYPDDVAAVVALGAATDLASYHACCRLRNSGTIKEIADAIEASYGGTPDKVPDVYRRHSAVVQSSRLTMPVCVIHGEADALIPVEQTRLLHAKMRNAGRFRYEEIPGGDHDSPLKRIDALNWALSQLR